MSSTDFQPFFNKFLGSLALDTTRVERIESARRHLLDVVENDERLMRRKPTLLIQGSYGQSLAVRPADADEEYDVDLVLEMNIAPSATSAATLDWLHDRLALDGVFRPKLRRHDRCVRIQYAGDFHLDVVPGRRLTASGVFRGIISAPDRSAGWRRSYPRGFMRWCDKQNERTGGDFQRVVMLLKRWRDVRISEAQRVRSIVFTTLLGRCVPDWGYKTTNTRPDADVLTTTLVRLDRYLQGRTRVPRITNPSLPSENLTRRWTEAHYRGFRNAVHEAVRSAGEARAWGDPAAWRMLFGGGFPTDPR